MEPRVGPGGRLEELSPGSFAVYPPTPGVRDFAWGLFAIGVGVGVLAVVLTASAGELEPGDKVLFGPVFAVVMLCIGVSVMVGDARQLRSPRPYLLVDGLGVACAPGRVGWSSIDRFEAVAEENDNPRVDMVLAVLAPGTRLVTCKGLVSNGSAKRGQDVAFRFWASADRVRETLREFYSGPIDFSGESRSEARDDAGRRTAESVRSGDDEPRSSRPRPDRLPLVVVSLTMVLVIVAGIAAALELGKLLPSHDATGVTGATPRPDDSTSVQVERSRAPSYAKLTPGQATRLAVSDLGTLVGIGESTPDDAQLVTSGRRLSRTRCFHSGRWKPYWSVSFAGGSPIFESRDDALIFCNRDPHVIEVSQPIRH